MNSSTGQSEIEEADSAKDGSLSGRLAASLADLQSAEEELRVQNVALLETQEALQLEQQQYRALFDSAPHLYLVTNLHGTIRMANRAAMAVLSPRADNLTGKPLVSIVALEDRRALRERVIALARAADAMPPVEMEIELQPTRSVRKRCVVTVARSTNPSDGSGTLLWMLRDAQGGTLQRAPDTRNAEIGAASTSNEALAELRRANAELKAANRETLLLLHREQKVRRALERAESAKAHFFAVLSHELRTPLQAIFGFTELLRHELGDAATSSSRDYLHRIERSEQHLLGLINNILDFERMTHGSPVHVDLAAVPVGELLETLETMVSGQAAETGLELDVRRADASLVAMGDREMVQQVLLNLLTNAIKFTPVGGHVTVDAQHRADGMVAIMVCDTGRGIPVDELERIFEPFVQVATRDSRHGAGLGLAISRNIARSLGGELTAESHPGDGSKFTLTLVAATASATARTPR